MKHKAILGLVAGLLAGGLAQAEPTATQVRSWASTCATCHGTDGRAARGMPPLAGMDRDDALEKLLDYKSGAKPATVMGQISKGYSDEQLAAIAGWFSQQKK